MRQTLRGAWRRGQASRALLYPCGVEALLSLHDRFASVLVLYLAASGLWGLLLGIRGVGPTAGYRGALVIAEAVVVLQGALGVGVLLGGRPVDPIHLLYGAALVVALPLAWTLVRDRQPRGQSVALGLAALFAAGLALRGMATA